MGIDCRPGAIIDINEVEDIEGNLITLQSGDYLFLNGEWHLVLPDSQAGMAAFIGACLEGNRDE